jgi:hypothetical protein
VVLDLLDPAAMRSLARGLRERSAALRRIPVRRLLRGLAAVHREWARACSPLREEAVARLHETTGYPASVLDRSLRLLFARMDAAEMEGWLAAGGVLLPWLDERHAGQEGVPRVFGPALTAVISSGNIPGAAVPSVAQALLLKSPCLVKTSSSEPVLLPMYARSIRERAPDLREALVVTGWEGGRADLEEALLGEVDALIAYGGDAALRDLRSRLPLHARFLPYGHRISFSAVGREALSERRAAGTARKAALDFCVFDQQGCLSPQAVYVERGGGVGPEGFAALLAEALEELAVELPRRKLDPSEAAAIHQFRASAELSTLGGEEQRLWASPEGTRWTVFIEEDPRLRPCILNRTVVVLPVDRLEELPRWIEPQREALISVALGVGTKRHARIAGVLAAAGLTRITALGRAQEPETSLYHDGINAVAALARFARVEG